MEYTTFKNLKQGYISRVVGNEVILVPLTAHIDQMTAMYSMNETAGFIWKHVDQTENRSDMVRKIVEHFDVSTEMADNDLTNFMEAVAKAFDPA